MAKPQIDNRPYTRAELVDMELYDKATIYVYNSGNSFHPREGGHDTWYRTRPRRINDTRNDTLWYYPCGTCYKRVNAVMKDDLALKPLPNKAVKPEPVSHVFRTENGELLIVSDEAVAELMLSVKGGKDNLVGVAKEFRTPTRRAF
jgi:hypothetical protein